MKKSLSVIPVIFGVLFSVNSALADTGDFVINKYDIDLNFKKNNTVNVSENINVDRKSKGIERVINLQNISDKQKREIHNVETNDIHVISPDEYGFKTIRIVDTKTQKGSEKDYSFNYDFTYDNNLYPQDFSYDIIDGTWEQKIDKVNFNISLPFVLKNKKVEFISSTQGVINNDNLNYSILDNTISGQYTKTILPNEVLTLHITPKNKKWFTTRQNQIILNDVREEKITLYENDEIIIRLKSNPTTGFVWQMSVDPEDENIISLSEENYIPDKTKSKMSGSGGISEFKVRALSKGEATITGIYVRPWMKYEDIEDNSVEYTIEVK